MAILAGPAIARADPLTVSIRVSELSSPPGFGEVAIAPGPSSANQLLHGADATLSLQPGTYTLTTAGGHGTFGTFTISGQPEEITAVSGAVTADGTTVHFNASALAAVGIVSSPLSSPPGLGTVHLAGASGYIYGTDPTLYLPSNAGNGSYLIETPGQQGCFGTFDISSQLEVTNPTGALSLQGNTIGFSATELASVQIESSVLSDPTGLVAVFINGTTNYIAGTNPTLLLPRNCPGARYEIMPPGVMSTFGTFTVAGTPPQAGELTGALLPMDQDEGITFDNSLLAHIELPWHELSDPAGLVPVIIRGVSATVWYGADPILYLPANFPSNAYEVISPGDQGTFGTFRISPSLEVSAVTGYVDANPIGQLAGIDFLACDLFNVRVEPPASGPGSSWFINGASSFFTGPATLRLPENRSAGSPYQTAYFAGNDVAITSTFLLTPPDTLAVSPIAGQPAPDVSLEVCGDEPTPTPVVDDTPPSVNGSTATPTVLWPPNHKMVDVTVGYTVTDDFDAPSAVSCSLSVSSNEAVSVGGSGNTDPDWVIVDAHHVRLRAERSGSGTGRFYMITITCEDTSGNATSVAVTVSVPHDMGK